MGHTDEPPLPDDLAARPPTLDELEETVALFNACDRPFVGGSWHSVTELRWFWTHPEIDVRRDARIVRNRAGSIVAYQQVYSNAPCVEHRVWGRVHPEQGGRGIGSALLGWADRSARRRLAEAPDGARVIMHGWCFPEQEASRRLLLDHGFAPVRHTLHMRLDLAGRKPLAPRWPAGVRVERFDPSCLRELYDASAEAFRDHWGHVPVDPEKGLERFRHAMKELDAYHPDLWTIARDGASVAGFCLCRDRSEEDPDMGWVDDLGVLPGWRRRGLGAALLQNAIETFRVRGKPRVGLAVDAESLTGATRLYEKAGMEVYRRFESHHKELREGRDLATR